MAAERLDKEAKLPDDNWLNRRVDTIRSHEPSIQAALDTIDNLGHILLEGRVSTDLRMHGTNNLDSDDPASYVALNYFNIIPVIHGSDRVATDEFNTGWQPETAMNIQLALKDRYDYSGSGKPRPTGDVQLSMYIRTWGKLSDEDLAAINAMPDTWAEYTDNGWRRKGTQVMTVRKPGEALTADQVEGLLAPLADHVIHYFDIAGIPNEVRKTERPGNFSTGARIASRLGPEQQWRGQSARPNVRTKQVAAKSLNLFQLGQQPT
jgi:hypothetical protein